jgi:hypothetical protein
VIPGSRPFRYSKRGDVEAGVLPLSFCEAVEQMDFEVVYDRTDWTDPEVKQRRLRAKKYELLVPGPIALDMITGF